MLEQWAFGISIVSPEAWPSNTPLLSFGPLRIASFSPECLKKRLWCQKKWDGFAEKCSLYFPIKILTCRSTGLPYPFFRPDPHQPSDQNSDPNRPGVPPILQGREGTKVPWPPGCDEPSLRRGKWLSDLSGYPFMAMVNHQVRVGRSCRNATFLAAELGCQSGSRSRHSLTNVLCAYKFII